MAGGEWVEECVVPGVAGGSLNSTVWFLRIMNRCCCHTVADVGAALITSNYTNNKSADRKAFLSAEFSIRAWKELWTPGINDWRCPVSFPSPCRILNLPPGGRVQQPLSFVPEKAGTRMIQARLDLTNRAVVRGYQMVTVNRNWKVPFSCLSVFLWQWYFLCKQV